VIPAEDPDYDHVAQLSETLLTRSHDLRVAAILANAVLRIGDFARFGETLRYVHGCLDSYWDSVHPQLDEDDGDPTMRVNAALGLAAPEGLLRSLRLCPLVSSRGYGKFCLRDMEIASGDLIVSEDETAADPQIIAAAFHDIDPGDLAALVNAADGALQATRAIATIFDDRIGADGPDLTPLEKMLFDIKRRVSSHETTDSTAQDDTNETSEDRETTRTAPVRSGSPGTISSPDDVRAALARIIEYYQRHEPSSPLPLVLERAKRLVGADFLTIVRDLAPEGMGNVRNVGGIEPDEEDEGTYD
jgi:type VI secretion system protein ImpA